MRELLEYIDKNSHKKFVVIFDDLKRFARDVEFHLKLRAAFKARDVVLKCLNYNFDDSAEGRFVETILAAGSELERHQNRRQVVQKMKARLEAGYWAFGSKKGYMMIKDPLHGKVAIPNKTEAGLLKTALEGFSTGIFARPIDVCKYLVEQGLWDRKPERYTEKCIEYLKDPFYAGYIEYPNWEVERRIGHHEPIISLETFDLNQRRLQRKSENKRIRIDISDDFHFRGLLVCDECGKHLTGTNGNGRKKQYPYYFCQNSKCSLYRKTFSRKEIEDGFKVILEKQNLKPEIDGWLGVTFDRMWGEEVKNIEKELEAQIKSRQDLTKKIAQLSELAGTTKSETVREAYEKQIEDLSPILKQMEGEQPKEPDFNIPYRTALDKSSALLKSPYKYWESVDVVEKQRMFFFIFDEKLPYSKTEGYRTDKIPCATRLFEEFVSTDPLDVEMGGSEPPCNR